MDYETPRCIYKYDNYDLICNENFFDSTTISINNNEINICGIELYDNFNGNLVIPEKINGKPVTTLLSRHYSMISLTDMANKLKSIDMPSITKIGAGAFNNCKNLEKVNMPKVKEIYDKAFKNCTSLTNINMPSVETIGWGSFENCTSLTNIDIPNATTIECKAFEYCSNLKSVNMSKVKEIEPFSFGYCDNLTNISIPIDTFIPKNTFFNCSKLTIERITQDPPTQDKKTSLKDKIDNVKQKLECTKAQPSQKQIKSNILH